MHIHTRATRTTQAAPAAMALEGPFLHAPEGARTVFLVTFAAACLPLAGGAVMFGWRALWLAALCVASCAAIERLYFRMAGTPSLLGRSHAYLTGLLLALTLPPFAPWYAAVIASAFAIVVGKAIFGGVGHFVWQPALVGRLAATVVLGGAFAAPAPAAPSHWPVLARDRLLVGDVTNARRPEGQWRWSEMPAPASADAILSRTPSDVLAGLTRTPQPQFSALVRPPAGLRQGRPALIAKLPPMGEMLLGAYGGAIGQTCAVAILAAGLYLIYRNYVKWQLPATFLLAGAAVAAAAPIQLAGPDGSVQQVAWPIVAEGLDAGLIYVCYQLLGGASLLAGFFLATEMTSRPVTTGGQVIFGAGCGALTMLLQLYVDLPVGMAAYVAVLGMNTFTPLIESLWRPRVFGRRRLLWRLQERAR